MTSDSLTVWQAALLHDVGRLRQRAGEDGDHAELGAQWLAAFPELFPPDLESTQAVKAVIRQHHLAPSTRADRIIQAADWLASAEHRQPVEVVDGEHSSPLLIPPTARVSFLNVPPKPPGLPIGALSLTEQALFPTTATPPAAPERRVSYDKLLRGLEADLERCGTLSGRSGIVTLQAVLRKHTSLIPHTVPGETDEPYYTERDVSLFDHLKVTCAIAACLNAESEGSACFNDATLEALAADDSEKRELPIAYLLRGEVSGIQNFIYRITRAESDKGGTARRLRGRSFYVALIVDVIADWLIRKLGLPPANILFCGGGRFDLLLPFTAYHCQQVQEAEAELSRWLLKKFYGELSVQLAGDVAVHARHFQNFSEVHQTANERINEMKRRRFDTLLNEKFFLGWTGEDEPSGESEARPIRHICRQCHITPLEDANQTGCKECDLQSEIGRRLPKKRAQFLAFVYGKEQVAASDETVPISFEEPFNVTALLPNSIQAQELLRENPDREITLSRLNKPERFIFDWGNSAVAYDFRFLGNSAPVALRAIKSYRAEVPDLKPHHVLDFTHIANELNVGANLLGVLKMDVDHLGMLFGQGLEPLTLTRVSALSQSLDLFFSGWLNNICERVSRDWMVKDKKLRGLTDNLFYIVYSGGDDLLIIGPWAPTFELAQKIRQDFGKYCGNNPNVTLSGGAVLVKPHFPVHRFAPLADEELKQSKKIDPQIHVTRRFQKDRFTVFNQTVPWTARDEEIGFDELIEFADWLSQRVEDGSIPKSLVYLLLRLYDSHVKEDNSWQKAVWIPKFTYAAARRVPLKVGDEELGNKLIYDAQRMIEHIRLPISYVSLKTRKE